MKFAQEVKNIWGDFVDIITKGKHENYLLELISKIFLGVWVVSMALAMIGFLFGVDFLVHLGFLVMVFMTGWDRLMEYLTWREE